MCEVRGGKRWEEVRGAETTWESGQGHAFREQVTDWRDFVMQQSEDLLALNLDRAEKDPLRIGLSLL